MNKISPCLWFASEAEEAAKYYTSIFKHSKVGKNARYGDAGAQVSGQRKGSVMTVDFNLEGLQIEGLNGGPLFKFSPAVSFFVSCDSEAEIDSLWSKLSKGGSALWELKQYPWAEKYGWCTDKFGVSWQLILAKNKNKIAPAFLFTDKLFGKGEEAINFYVSQFKNSKIETIHHHPETKTVMHATFALDGQMFVLMEGQGEHKHPITPAISLIVNCKTQDEVDKFWDELSAGGSPGQCGWLQDRYGVSWQIVPTALGELLSGADAAKTEKVMQAMLTMKKLEIEKLMAAYK